jgi:hypothetical protein
MNDATELLLELHHPWKRDVRRRRRHAQETPRVLVGEEALRNDEDEHAGERHRRQRHHQREELMLEHPDEPAVVEVNHRLEATLGHLEELAVMLRLGLEEVRAHHRRERERQDRGHADRDAERDGELPEETPDDPTHEQQRNEHRDERDRE